MKYLAALLISVIAILIGWSVKAENLATSASKNFADTTLRFVPTPPPASTPKPKPAFDIHSKIGIAEIEEEGCLRTKNGSLTEKTPVSIIISLDEPPQKVVTRTVKKKLTKSCSRPASETSDKNPGKNYFYSLALTGKEAEETYYEVGIAVIDPQKAIQFQNDLATIDLNADGKQEFFRRCAGSEGIQFTIWTGKPLEGKRIWNSYFYLDYDTEENCDEKDWEVTKD